MLAGGNSSYAPGMRRRGTDGDTAERRRSSGKYPTEEKRRCCLGHGPGSECSTPKRMEEDKIVSIDTNVMIRLLVVDDDEEQCPALLGGPYIIL